MAVFATIGIFVCVPILVLFEAFVAGQLWTWFVAPLGVPRPHLATIYGLILMVRAVMPSHVNIGNMADAWAKREEPDAGKRLARQVLAGLLKPAIALLFGGIVVWAWLP